MNAKNATRVAVLLGCLAAAAGITHLAMTIALVDVGENQVTAAQAYRELLPATADILKGIFR